METVGRRIKSLRGARGLSQAVLARRAGMATLTVFRVEHGQQSPTLALLGRIARALRVDVADLIPRRQRQRRRR